MQIWRTDQARLELKPGSRMLSQKQRRVLLLSDGKKSRLEFRILFDGEGEQISLGLVRDGYLELRSAVAPARPAATPPGPLTTAPQRPVVHDPSSASPPAAPPVAADNFEGKRSLATTRMFLFDLCERMSGRHDPELVARLREALRAAKDRESMLQAGREMLMEIERIAGPKRADASSERIAMLLPPERASI